MIEDRDNKRVTGEHPAAGAQGAADGQAAGRERGAEGEQPAGHEQGAAGTRGRRIAIAVAAVALIIVLALLLMRCSAPRDIAPKKDVAAQDVATEEPKMDAAEGGGAVNITFTQDVSIDVGDGRVSMYLKNPSRSTHDMALELLVQDGDELVSVAKSGLIPAGYELSQLELSGDVVLHPGTYEGKFTVSFYDPETGDRAYVDTDIPLPTIQAVA